MSGDEIKSGYTNQYSQLFFCYNTQTSEIMFSSSGLEIFFGYPVNIKSQFPFININHEQTILPQLANEWQHCLHLKEKEAGNFYFKATSTNGTPVVFNFDAVGLTIPAYENLALVLFSVKKNPVLNPVIPQNKIVDIYQKDYAEFIDIAAHDLDAPLRKLTLLLDRLTNKNKTEPGSDVQDYFTRIQTCIGDMRLLVDSLARLSGLNSKTGKNISCDINSIVQEIVNDFQLMEQDKKLSVTLSGLPVIEGDKAQYKQLFQNLLQNSIRYCKKDLPPEIKINAVPVASGEKIRFGLADDKNWYMITIADNGIGFNQEYAEKIFRPFVRLHGKSEYPGTGMGLAICKKIIENHGGIIFSESTENKGATFTLILPQSLN